MSKYQTSKVKLNWKREIFKQLIMAPNTTVNGTLLLIKDMVVASKFGVMGAFMKETGLMIKQMDMAGLFMLKVMSIMANGKTIWHVVLDHTLIVMVPNMKETG